jgi:hypothetical protein
VTGAAPEQMTRRTALHESAEAAAIGGGRASRRTVRIVAAVERGWAAMVPGDRMDTRKGNEKGTCKMTKDPGKSKMNMSGREHRRPGPAMCA